MVHYNFGQDKILAKASFNTMQRSSYPLRLQHLLSGHSFSSAAFLSNTGASPLKNHHIKKVTSSRGIVETLRNLVVETYAGKHRSRHSIDLEHSKMKPFPNLREDTYRKIGEDNRYNEKAFARWNN